jgi:hypothetical protein
MLQMLVPEQQNPSLNQSSQSRRHPRATSDFETHPDAGPAGVGHCPRSRITQHNYRVETLQPRKEPSVAFVHRIKCCRGVFFLLLFF